MKDKTDKHKKCGVVYYMHCEDCKEDKGHHFKPEYVGGPTHLTTCKRGDHHQAKETIAEPGRGAGITSSVQGSPQVM